MNAPFNIVFFCIVFEYTTERTLSHLNGYIVSEYKHIAHGLSVSYAIARVLMKTVFRWL